MSALPVIKETRREKSPAASPQALAWHDDLLWVGSRDVPHIYAIDPRHWSVRFDSEAPGIPWAAVSVGREIRFNIGIAPNDDRYIMLYLPGAGFSPTESITCPDFTGSYLSFDGENIYLSQWYEHRILQLDAAGAIHRTFAVGAEISGHTFVDGRFYVLYGTEKEGGENESWQIGRLNPQEKEPRVEPVARVPFACRSLTFDGSNFWTNHRVAHETVCFALPA